MSIRFQIASALVKTSGMKKLFALPQEELLEKARKMNRKRGFQIPTRKQFRYTERTILGQYSCLKIETQPTPSKRALLFFFGGGYILGPDDGDVKLAERFGKVSGRDVWFPYRTLVEEVQREAERFYSVEMDTFIGYDKWLAWHRDVVHSGTNRKKKGKTQFQQFKWSVPIYDEESPDFIETPLISGDFLNSVPGAMEMFVPELAAEIEEKIKADQESDHPSPDKCINISITTDQLVRLVNGIKEAKRKKG